MLQLTDAAMDSLRAMRGDSAAPDDAAVRFYVEGEAANQRIGFAFGQEVPDTDEKVADHAGLEVYVARELADPLSESVVDARKTDQGGELFLRDQEGGE